MAEQRSSLQLTLDLVQPLSYSSERFQIHAGVEPVVEAIDSLATRRSFACAYVQGARQSGKTHLGVYLCGQRQGRRGAVRMVAAGDLRRWCVEELPREPVLPWELVVLDDADRALSEPACHGILVDLIERVARQKGFLLLLGSADPGDLCTSPQLRSRLNAGVHVRIGPPHEDELDRLITRIAQQRGLRISGRQRAAALKRIGRTVEAVVAWVERVERGDA